MLNLCLNGVWLEDEENENKCYWKILKWGILNINIWIIVYEGFFYF